jgi:phosphoglycolate phosphatase
MNDVREVDSIIFDMDGTLWDAVATYAKAWDQYYRVTKIDGLQVYDRLMANMGVEEKMLLGLMLPHISEENRSAEYNLKVVPMIYSTIAQLGGNIYDGVLTGLKELSARYRLFIVSNCPARTIDCFMDYADIRRLITDSMAHGQNYKSKAENIQLLMDKHHLKQAVYVGDTESDRLQSEKAGVPFVFINYGFGKSGSYLKSFSNFSILVDWFLSIR